MARIGLFDHASFEEDKQKINVTQDSKILLRLIRYVAPYKLGMAAAMLMIFLVAGVKLLPGYLTMIAFDEAIAKDDYPKLVNVAVLFLIVTFIGTVVSYVLQYLVNYIGQRIMRDLALDLFAKFQSLSLTFFNHNPVGRLVTRLSNDIQSLRDFFTTGIVALLHDVLILVGVVIVMMTLNLRLALFCFIPMPIMLIGSIFFRRAIRKSYDQIRVRIARVNAYLNENITGMKVVQLFNAQEETQQQFRQHTDEHMEAWLKTVRHMSVFLPFIRLLGGMSVAIVIWYGGGNVIREVTSLGTLLLFVQYVTLMINPLRQIAEQYNVFLSAIAAAQKIFTTMDSEEKIPHVDNPLPLITLHDNVEFRNVTFSYNSSETILDNVSFKIHKNEKVAIVGATGAGKTTIINLLYRFYDINEGEILIDGHNIKNYDPKELRRNFGLVQQDVFLFSGSILDNIRLGDESISLDRVKAAARLVNAHKFIEKFPEQYDAIIGERGTGLSTGEKQLLAFARTVALDPKIMLVLDEATSNIDSETERLIQEGLEHMLKDRTALIIAHRLSTIKKADKIIVIHHGKIHEIGTQQELLRKKGLFYNLYQLQFTQISG